MYVAADGVLTLAALGVVGAEAEEARLALVTARPFHVGLAAALTGHHAQGGFGVAVAHPAVLRAVRVAVASFKRTFIYSFSHLFTLL